MAEESQNQELALMDYKGDSDVITTQPEKNVVTQKENFQSTASKDAGVTDCFSCVVLCCDAITQCWIACVGCLACCDAECCTQCLNGTVEGLGECLQGCGECCVHCMVCC